MKPSRLAVFALLCFSSSAIAQTTAHSEFEVAAIKPGSLGLPGGTIRRTPGGRLTVTNMTVKELIAQAWNLQPFQISGGPSWIDSARYDISAKPESSASNWDETALMLQSLLADRFKLTMHRDTKELPIYALVLAKKDGKLGPGLAQSKEGGCVVPDPSKPLPRPEPGKLPAMSCANMIMNPRFLRAVSVPAAKFAVGLSRIIGRTVVDQTGLTGNFDISLDWTPDEAQYMQLPPGVAPPAPSDAPISIFTAMQEQLGLKLESRKGPVEIFVIDRAEKPSEN